MPEIAFPTLLGSIRPSRAHITALRNVSMQSASAEHARLDARLRRLDVQSIDGHLGFLAFNLFAAAAGFR